MEIITLLDYIGVFVFALSGVLTASGKKLDLFGGLIIAFVTALGGGTIRDLFLNAEIGWIVNTHYVYIVIGGAVFALIFKKVLSKIRKTIFLFDTIGISLFTILGVQKALEHDTPLIIAVIFLISFLRKLLRAFSLNSSFRVSYSSFHDFYLCDSFFVC